MKTLSRDSIAVKASTMVLLGQRMVEQLRRAVMTMLIATCFALGASGVRADVAAPQVGDEVSTKAFDAATLRREAEEAVKLSGGLSIRASKPALREGESLVLTIDLPRAGYLNVVSINPEGVPTVLFPNQVQGDNKVEAGAFTFPSDQMKFELRASPPYGASLITAFLTREPLNLYTNGEGGPSMGGSQLEQFARLSLIGRDLISRLSTKNLVVDPQLAPMAAGMTTVLACAKTGPCEAAAPTTGSRLLRIADALMPGILLEPEDKAFAKEPRALRPVSGLGLRLTKVSEGFVPRLYEDVAGYCGIAYGHLIKRKRCGSEEHANFPRGINEPDGSRLLLKDMARAQRAVMALVTAPMTDGQYAALCDFTYNVGSGNLKRSTLLKAVNASQHHRVPFQLRRWSRAGNKEYRGLKIRREREIALYFDGSAIPTVVPKGEELTPLDIRSGESER